MFALKTSSSPQKSASLNNSPTLKCCFFLGALISGISVALQAASAHLPDSFFLSPHGRQFVTNAGNIALWHGIALCALTLGAPYLHPFRIRLACITLTIGTILFASTVTLFSFHIINTASPAPWGGSLIIMSWLIIASSIFKPHSSR